MTRKHQIARTTLQHQNDLLEAQYRRQEVEKEADDYTNKVFANLRKHNITVRISYGNQKSR